jgi:hypothetical protein
LRTNGNGGRLPLLVVSGLSVLVLFGSKCVHAADGAQPLETRPVIEQLSDRIQQSRPVRRDAPLRELNLSDNEVREIQAVAHSLLPGSIVNISGVVEECPCEEGPTCSDQVWIVAHRSGESLGLQLSRVSGRWTVGVLQQWWLSFDRLRKNRSPGSSAYTEAFLELQDQFPVCSRQAAYLLR